MKKMNFKIVLIVVLAGFSILCGGLIIEAGLFKTRSFEAKPCILLQQTTAEEKASAVDKPASANAELLAAEIVTFEASGGPVKTITLGSLDSNSGFEFQLELSSKGAAVRKATFSGFNNRDYKNPQPLAILLPVSSDDSEILSMANKELVLIQQQLQFELDKLSWKSFDVEKTDDGSQTALFEAVIKNQASGEPFIKVTKSYKISPHSYNVDCNIAVENLSNTEQKIRFNLGGPLGIGREDVSRDMRKAVAGFRDSKGQIVSRGLDIKSLEKAKNSDELRLAMPGANFLWVAATNKYFAAILVPELAAGENYCDWVTDKAGQFYNADGDKDAASGDETIGTELKIASTSLAAAGQGGSAKTYSFLLYLGPKDKSVFDKNELYRNLGFFQTIDFMPCFCCPAAIINPLAFGVLTTMKWMYDFIPNYGVVIIILVFLIRLVMHPITKKSQVSMSKFGKLAPKAEEIKKKYANNKVEMNKQMMALYKEQGASPIMGMLPMFVQMPIWIALYSAINASIALRGAPFLWFWITDLSSPDILFRFPAVSIPLFGQLSSVNLLPLLMGVAFYLQQKLMPSQAAAPANPQAAQQQKMMMIMMPILFPLMLYNAPSGLNLYIMASTFAGVVEQYIIKKHIREKEEAEAQGLVAATSKTGGKIKKKKPKPFFKKF